MVLKRTTPLTLAQNLIGAERHLELMGFFSPSLRGKGRHKTTKVLEAEDKKNGHKIRVSIIPADGYDRPNTVDLDIYRAFFKILKEIYFKHGKIENPVVFKDEDLIKAMDKPRHGRLNKEIHGWLRRMKLTGILSEMWIYDKKSKRPLSDLVTVFERVTTYGEPLTDGRIADTNIVELSDWFLGNINHGYIFLIDHEFYKKLRYPISKCLYGMLWWGLYATKQKGGEFYWKDYQELCKLLDITSHKYEALIKQQLGVSHKELVESKLISKWEIEKNLDGKSFNIKWWAGEVFESYYLTLKKGKGQLTLSGILEETTTSQKAQLMQLAEKLVKYFHQQVKGRKDYQPKEKELERAREIIEKYQAEKAWFITKFAVARIKETNFDQKVEYFGAVINYADEALKKFEQTQKRKQAQAEKRQKENEEKMAEYKAWLESTPEQRVQGRLDFWINYNKTFKHRELTEEEIKIKQQELIESEPAPAEKQEKIFGRVIFKGETLEFKRQ